MTFFTCSENQNFRSTFWPVSIALSFFLIAAPGLASEQTVLVAPAADSVALPISSTILEQDGPYHGALIHSGGQYTFEPTDQFWSAGQDVLTYTTTSSSAEQRIRLVAGTTAADGIILSPVDPGFGTWQNWALEAGNGGLPAVVTGSYSPVAYEIDFGPSNNHPSIIGGNFNPQTAFSVCIGMHLDEPDRFETNTPIGNGETVVFYRFKNQDPASLDVYLHLEVKLENNEFKMRPVSAYKQDAAFEVIKIDHTSIRIERRYRAGVPTALVFVNDRMRWRLQVSDPSPTVLTEHEISSSFLTTDTQNLSFKFENPTVFVSDTVADPTERDILEGFGGGLVPQASSSDWAAVVESDAMSTSAQDLPGLGYQLDIDLGAIGAATRPTDDDHHAYLSKHVESPPGGSENMPRGTALRFWYDSTNLSIPVGTQLVLASICGPTPPCGAIHVRLRHHSGG
ncbi:MAG: hypothetical protein AAF725_22690, partial [Acidobacteriota bacterium]